MPQYPRFKTLVSNNYAYIGQATMRSVCEPCNFLVVCPERQLLGPFLFATNSQACIVCFTSKTSVERLVNNYVRVRLSELPFKLILYKRW